MIKLATVFSGIGAIEHALQRMKLDHRIIFACDNGDVDILSKKIQPNIDEIDTELAELNELIQNIHVINDDKLYKSELEKMLYKTNREYNKIKVNLKKGFDLECFNNTIKLFDIIILTSNDLSQKKKKEYMKFMNDLECSDGINKTLKTYQYILQIMNDFKKENSLIDFMGKNNVSYYSSDNINWNEVDDLMFEIFTFLEKKNGKKIIRQVKDICDRAGMLHEKINSFHILKNLAQISDFSKKKEYVDNLYRNNNNQNKVRQSYMANYNIDEKDFHWNVSFLDGRQYNGQVDLFVGGSPCQSFSLVGKQRGLEDTRGTLFYEYARLIREIQPKVFIYENVKAILSNDNGKTWDKMKEIFKDLGYVVYFEKNGKPSVLNAKDFGVPQNRERMFVVGFRKDLELKTEFSFPDPIPLKKTMQDFLLDNVSGRYYLQRKGVNFVTDEKNLTKKFTQIDGDIQLCQKKNQQFNWHGDFVFVEENKDNEKTIEDLEKYFLSEKVIKYVLSTGTKNFYSRPEIDLKVARPLLTTMHKMHRAGVDNYVTTDGRIRKLTPRECLRLMGFCDSFKIVVSDTAAYQQAGNSIVVDVLIYIVNSILESYPNLAD